VKRLRVLHVIQNLNYGGMERLFADIVRLLDPARFESHVMVMEYLGRFGLGLESHATIHQAASLPRWSMLHPGPLIRQIKAIAPDVIHSHSGVWFKVSLAGRRAGVPRIVHTEHGRRSPDPLVDRALGRLAARRTDVVVAVSAALEEHLAHHVVGDASKLVVLENGVDTDLHRPRGDTGKLRAELGLAPEVPIIGSIGRLEFIKGYDVVVEAMAHLLREWDRTPAPVLVIGGEGSERGRIQQLVGDRGLANQVHLLGWRDDVHDLHSAFSLFTMGSRSEGTSVSLLEAMSAGLVPVVTKVGGNAAVLGKQLSHRLIPPLDPAALAQGWSSVLGSDTARTEDSRFARERVELHFALRTMVEGYAALYTGSSRERPRPTSPPGRP
jgi:glycosyltransferase involved in cell wall biosynthesis